MAEASLTVLWATDGSPASRAALPVLRQLVLPVTAKLYVLCAAPHPLLSAARPDPAYLARATPAARRRALADARQHAENDATALDPGGVPVEAVAVWGHPIEQILRSARGLRADLVVLGAKGHSNLGLALLGSVSQGVVQHATFPVLIARPDTRPIDTVLVGYDGSGPARKALAFLRRFDLASARRLVLVYVIEPFQVPPATPIAYRKRALEAAHAINQKRHRDAARSLEAARRSLADAGIDAETEVLSGPPADLLRRAAEERRAQLLVIGSRKPSATGHYLLGSTAEKLVRHARASLLLVR